MRSQVQIQQRQSTRSSLSALPYLGGGREQVSHGISQGAQAGPTTTVIQKKSTKALK